MKKINTTLNICGNCQHMTNKPCQIAGMSDRMKCDKADRHVKHMSPKCEQFEEKTKEHAQLAN